MSATENHSYEKKNESACVSPLFLQEFGGLILLDLQYHIVGISAQALHLTAYNTTTFIGISMQTFFSRSFSFYRR